MIELLEDKACGKYCDLTVQWHGCQESESLGTSNRLRGAGQARAVALIPFAVTLGIHSLFAPSSWGENRTPYLSHFSCYLLPTKLKPKCPGSGETTPRPQKCLLAKDHFS